MFNIVSLIVWFWQSEVDISDSPLMEDWIASILLITTTQHLCHEITLAWPPENAIIFLLSVFFFLILYLIISIVVISSGSGLLDRNCLPMLIA